MVTDSNAILFLFKMCMEILTTFNLSLSPVKLIFKDLSLDINQNVSNWFFKIKASFFNYTITTFLTIPSRAFHIEIFESRSIIFHKKYLTLLKYFDIK